MSLIRYIKFVEILLHRYPKIYKVGKRVLSVFYSDKIYDFAGLIDKFATSPDVLYFRNYGKKNPNIPIYYITYGVFNQESCGFFGMLNTTLKNLYFADFYNLVPVVEWGKGIYSEAIPVHGTENTFEYYFEQVSDVNYRTVKHSAHVCLAMFGDTKIIDASDEVNDKLTDNQIELLANIFKKYIHLNKYIKDKINDEVIVMLKNKKTLGVQARGSDGNWELYGHPVSVTPQEYIDNTYEVYVKHQYKQIFLATEDPIVLGKFLRKFGCDVLIYYEQNTRSEKGAIDLAAENHGKKFYNYQMGYEVLRDAYTLAACDSLVGGIHNVPLAARIIKESQNESFQECRIIDKGISFKKNFYTKSVYKR